MPRRQNNRRLRYIAIADRILESLGRQAGKTFHALHKQDKVEAARWNRMASVAEVVRRIDFQLATSDYQLRRLNRRLVASGRSIETGEETSAIEKIRGWVIDVFLFLCAILWSYVKPILERIFYSLLQMVLVVLFSFLLFGMIYLIFTI